jgi:hypothetical protein
MAKSRAEWNSKVATLKRNIDDGIATRDDIIHAYNYTDELSLGHLKDWLKERYSSELAKAIEILEDESIKFYE